MIVRTPAPLRPGDLIAVTAPSAGVPAELLPRLDFCADQLRRRGFDVRLGHCLDGTGMVSAPAAERAAELQAMLLDPAVRAIVPPWGGELAVELLAHLDLEAIAAADPTWVVGFSDVSTLLLPLTTVCGVATLHGQNLMDMPYAVPPPLLSWLDVVTRPAGSRLTQGPSTHHRGAGFDEWATDPQASVPTLDTAGSWSLLDPTGGPVDATGRLIGGCIETVSVLAGTRFGDLSALAEDGLIVYVEAAEGNAAGIARGLWAMRLAGWFDAATAVLVGRTRAPDDAGFTQRDAVRSAVGDVGIPVVLDVDCGHLPPHLALVNGAIAELTLDGRGASLVQTLP